MRDMPYTLDDLVNAVREVAAERPDFIYKRRTYTNHEKVCVYTEPDGTPSCIIGVALARVGDPVPSWDEDRFYSPSVDRELTIFGTRVWLDYFGIDNIWNESDEVRSRIHWLNYLQNQQDNGATWSEAVEWADRNYAII